MIVVYYIAQVVPAAVVSFPHAHRVVCQVDIAIVAKDWRGMISSPGFSQRSVLLWRREA